MKQLTLTVLLLVVVFGLRAQSLLLTSPNGGEVWLGGSVHNITWTYSNVDNIKIEYSLNNGLNWTIITPSYPCSALSYSWTVPCIGSNLAKVRITNTLQFTQDESNTVFTIPEPTVDITYPNGGESFGTGTGQYIEWATTGVTTVKVQYTVNNGAAWTDIGNFPAVNNYCNWIAPAGLSSEARIRAFNIESTRNRDSSATLFNIVGMPTLNADKYKGGALDGYNMCPSQPDTIRVLTPNGGEVYSPTNSVTLNWSFRHIDQIKIEYSTDNGSSWNLIVNDIPASQLSYAWTIPNAPSNQCRLKITSLRTGLSDMSDAPFTINAAFVNVLYPNGGESFGTGTGQYIEWDYNSVATVKLEYSTNNGSTWTTIGTAPAVNKYANWIPPATVTSQCLIRISDNALPSVNDASNAAFALFNLPALDVNKYKGGLNDGYSMNSNRPDTIRVTSPNGGELWTAASTRTITWTYNEVDNVAIELTLDDGATWTTLAASVPASQLSYSWTVPTTPSYTCRIRVRDIARPIQDVSDAVFIIPTSYVQITYPNGGESFGATTGQYIEWDYNDLATIKLEYSVNNGSTWSVIGTAPAANKYANWVVPATASSQILIRATDIANPIYTDNSNAVFSSYTLPTLDVNKYKGGQFDGYSMYAFKDVYVKVIKPNGGEIWGNGTTQQIKWATLNTTENLKVEYSIDNESTWTTLLNDVPNSPVTFNWNIASPVSTICKVRATTMSGVEFDKSDDFFTIANPAGIITNPIAGNTFCSGESTTVTFNRSVDFNPGNKFIVQLSDSVGTFNGSLINIGEITATEPAPINVTFPPRYYTSNLYRLRVIGTNPPTLGTDNGSNFTINPLPDVRLGRDTTICAGTTITLNATSSGSNYLWSTGSTSSSIQVSQAGQYWVAATNSCGTTRDTIQVGVRQAPTVNLGPDRLICLNSSIVLAADSGAYNYLWSTGAVTRAITVVLPGTYTVTVSNACGSATDNVAVSNIPAATLNLGADRGLCAGESVVLNAGNAGATYLWSNGSTAQTITVTTPGTYSVNVTTSCGTISDQITFYNGAFQVNAGIDRTICNGESAQLTATGANAYSWNTGQTTSSITVSPTATTTYTVSATNIYNCTSTDAVVVNVNALPVATSMLSGPATYCANQPSVLQANAGSGLSYQWQLNGTNVSGATAVAYSPTATGNYAVRVTNAQNCSATSAPQAITVLTVPSASITPSGNVNLCSGNSVSLQANSGDGLSYAWNRNGSSISGANATSLLATQGGSYTVHVTAANGCFATSAATQITVNETPTISIAANGPVNFCSGGSVQLTATATSGTTIQWEKDGVALVGATGATYTATSAGIYSARATSGSNCSSTSGAIVVTVSPIENVSQNESTCGSYTWAVNGTTYNSSGQYTATVGCTNYTLNLTISGGTTCDDNDPCTVNDLILADCSCAGTFADADNDGTCDANDNCAGPEAGTACDDNDPCTINDIILADCSCAGTFADADNDGTCDANDNCAGPEAGAACDDNNPCTVNDIILADCSCAGTFADTDNDGICDANDNCAGPEAGAACDDNNPCTVNDVILADCSCAGTFADADNDGTCDASDNCAGPEAGAACDDYNPCTVNDLILADCSCAGTFADTDNDGTCDASDNCAGPEAGAACDDNNPCTVNDVILADCSCAGTFADADNDGTCDASDNCAGPEAGNACDDSDPCTINDIILADCSCAGTFADADNDGTCDVNDNCAGPEAGTVCDDNEICTVNDIILADCSCAGTFADTDNDGICDANDNCAGPEEGTACDDNDPCTVGDVILADCSCAGTFADADNDGICDALDNCMPQFVNPPADTTYACDTEVPSPETLTATDCCGGNTVEFFGDTPLYGASMGCTVATPAGPGIDWGFWLNGLYPQFATTDWYRWMGSPEVLFLPNLHEVRITGDVVAMNDPTSGWHIDITLNNGMNWEQWSAEGGLYMDAFGFGAASHTSWNYYYLVATISHLTGFGDFAGDQLILSHQPVNHSYGFQFGQGANNRNTNEGGSGWFFYTGHVNGEAVSGHGDMTMDTQCGEVLYSDPHCTFAFERRWAATDNCGYVSYHTQEITIEDTVAPTFTNCPENVEVTCAADAPMPVEASELIAIDNCSSNAYVLYIGADTSYADACTMIITHHYTAADDCLNRSDCFYTITVRDNEAPVLIVPNDYTASCSEDLVLENATATDNCTNSPEVVVETMTGEGDCEYTITRIFTATDACGNSTSASQVIHVIDTEAPAFVNLVGPYYVECNDIYNNEWVRPAAIDNCDSDLTYTYTDEMTSGGCLGTLHRTMTITDNCGNATTREFLIYIQDTTAPVFTSIPADATVQCGDSIPSPNLNAVFAFDNCGADATLYGSYSEGRNAEITIEMQEQIIPGECAGTYTLLRIWMAIDYCGNASSDTTTITVVDTTPPVASSVPANQSIECSQFNGGIYMENPTFTDNCSSDLLLTMDVTEELVGCEHVYTYSWTATDECGNTTVISSTVHVYDESDPVFTSVPAGGTFSCDGGINFGLATAADNCGNTWVEYSDEMNAGNCAHTYTIVRTWTATDDCGNTATATSVYHVVDDIAPVFTSFPDDLTIECDSFEIPASVAGATDNCDSDVSIVYSDELVAESNCSKTIERTFVATDDCGNSTSQVQIIYVFDTTAPVITGNATISLSCDEFNADGVYVEASDNCGEASVVIMYDEPSGEGCSYSVIRHYAAYDDCENSSYFNQTIVVTDNEAPIASADPADMTYGCNENWAAAVISFSDNCDAEVTVVATLEELGTPCNQVYHYSWSATDDCGNTTVVDQYITVIDELAPVFDTPSTEITVECGTEVYYPNPLATDDCTADVAISTSVSEVEGNCSSNHTVITTYTATDVCGNSSSITFTVHYQDTTVPQWAEGNVNSFTYECDEQADIIEPIATDACSVIDYTFTDGEYVTDGCTGSFVRSWMAVDACGNASAVFNQNIYFIDTTEPILIGCPNDLTLACDAEVPVPSIVNAFDNCSSEVEVIFEETCIDCPDSGSAGYNLYTPVRPLENPCFYPYDWAMALFSLPSAHRWYQLDENTPSQLVYNSDGSVTVSGRVFNVMSPQGGFDFNVTYVNGKDWAEWSSDELPSGFKADCGGEGANYQDWMYYILQSGASFELTGWGLYNGSLLNLTHAPSNQYFGFQIGEGANNYNGDYGAGGWFNYGGVMLYQGQSVSPNFSGGIGDFAFRIDNCPEYSIVRTWTALDCAGNSNSCSQTIYFSTQENGFEGMAVNAQNSDSGRNPEIAIVGIQPNPANNHSSISFMSTADGNLTLEVLDMTGRLVSALFNRSAEAGRVYTIEFDADQLSSGIYMVRLSSGIDFRIERLQIQK